MPFRLDFADLSPYRARVEAAYRQPQGLDALINSFTKGAQQGSDLVNLPQDLQNQQLAKQIALATQQAQLEKLQRPQTFEVNGNIVTQDPVTGEFKSVFTAPPKSSAFNVAGVGLVTPDASTPEGYKVLVPSQARATTPTIHYETREDGTYAIPSNDPFNAVKINVSGTGAPLSGKTTTTKAPTFHYETREDGTYAISSENPTQAVRVTLSDGTVDASGINALSSLSQPSAPQAMPGRPKATGKSAKLSEDEKKMLLAGVSQSKILPEIVDSFKSLYNKNLAGPVRGRTESAKAALGYGNKEYTETQSKIKGNLFKLARALQGGGVLTEPDITRMEDIAPGLNVKPDQFIGGMQGVAGLMKDNLTSYLELNGGRLDAESLNSVNNAINIMDQFIKGAPVSSPVATLGINPNAPSPIKVGRFTLIPE